MLYQTLRGRMGAGFIQEVILKLTFRGSVDGKRGR